MVKAKKGNGTRQLSTMDSERCSIFLLHWSPLCWLTTSPREGVYFNIVEANNRVLLYKMQPNITLHLYRLLQFWPMYLNHYYWSELKMRTHAVRLYGGGLCHSWLFWNITQMIWRHQCIGQCFEKVIFSITAANIEKSCRISFSGIIANSGYPRYISHPYRDVKGSKCHVIFL